MRGGLWIGIIEQILNALEDLFDCNGWLPSLLFIQDRQANGSRRVDVWVEKGWDKFACVSSDSMRLVTNRRPNRTFGWFRWILWYYHQHRLSLSPPQQEYIPSGNRTSNLKRPPSHRVLSFPGIPHSHFFKSNIPVGVRTGLAKKPNG